MMRDLVRDQVVRAYLALINAAHAPAAAPAPAADAALSYLEVALGEMPSPFRTRPPTANEGFCPCERCRRRRAAIQTAC